eukprot:NODE_370_length_8652_cov_0.611715.p3 type:complete len:483 gc:universal NODE_370_length_8652_cov_0.611715:3482-4930(+)
MGEKTEISTDNQEHQNLTDAAQIKRKLNILAKEQQQIERQMVDFQDTSKKVLKNLENDSAYYISHLKDIEHSAIAIEKELVEKKESGKNAETLQAKLREYKNAFQSIKTEQQKLTQEILSVEIEPDNTANELKAVEISFEKNLNKFNTIRSSNATLREKISDLVKEKKLFEEQNHKLLADLKSLKLKIAQSIDGCNQNFELREELKMKVSALMDKNDKEKALFQSELLELERLIKEKQEEKEFKATKQEIRDFVNIQVRSKNDIKRENDIQLLKELDDFITYLETFKDYKSNFVNEYRSQELEIQSIFKFLCFEAISEVDFSRTHGKAKDLSGETSHLFSRAEDTNEDTHRAKELEMRGDAWNSLASVSEVLNLGLSLDNEKNFDYFLAKKIDPLVYFAEIEYAIDKLTLNAALKKAIIETNEESIGSIRHNSASTLSSEKPTNAKERLIIVNKTLLEPPHFSVKTFASIEYFKLIKIIFGR